MKLALSRVPGITIGRTPELTIGPELSALVEDSYGWTLYKLGRYDEAVSALDQAIADFPEKDTADPKSVGEALGTMYFHVGAAYRRQRHLDSARNALRAALRYAPENKEAKDELADMKSDAPMPAAPAPMTPKGTAGSDGLHSATLPSKTGPKASASAAPLSSTLIGDRKAPVVHGVPPPVHPR